MKNAKLLKKKATESSFWGRPDALISYKKRLDWNLISTNREKAEKLLHAPHWNSARDIFRSLNGILELEETSFKWDNGSLHLSSENLEEALLQHLIYTLRPWRNGPYTFGVNHKIDAEWRTNLKWDRIAPHLPNLKDKRVADLGCNNGYILARMQEREPGLSIGFDPSERCFYQFELIQSFLRNPNIQYELAGSSLLAAFPKFFNFISCMGVIYHRRDPIGFLQTIRESLTRNGVLLLESMCIADVNSTALCVAGRYARMHNVYFIPTPKALFSWLELAGFEPYLVFAFDRTTVFEQRQTEFAPFQSLEDFLSSDNPDLTIEGYPAPYRVSILARKVRE